MFFESGKSTAIYTVWVGFHEIVDFDLDLVLHRVVLLTVSRRYLVTQVLVEKILNKKITNVLPF